jgi:predicted nucleic acid-binding protein
VILLDTNVVSEAMRVVPDPRVLRWLNESETSDLYLSTITIAEVAYGLQILPQGRRRDAISERFQQFVNRGFSHRVLSFDEPAAFVYGEIMARRKSLGRPMSVPDGQIAAIAKTHSLVVATHNVGDFEPTGIELVNPWGD